MSVFSIACPPQRLRTENRLLKQRIDTLEKVGTPTEKEEGTSNWTLDSLHSGGDSRWIGGRKSLYKKHKKWQQKR